MQKGTRKPAKEHSRSFSYWNFITIGHTFTHEFVQIDGPSLHIDECGNLCGAEYCFGSNHYCVDFIDEKPVAFAIGTKELNLVQLQTKSIYDYYNYTGTRCSDFKPKMEACDRAALIEDGFPLRSYYFNPI